MLSLLTEFTTVFKIIILKQLFAFGKYLLRLIHCDVILGYYAIEHTKYALVVHWRTGQEYRQK